MSGIIYRTEMITDEFIEDFIGRNKNNEAYLYYPHLCLDIVLASRYDYCKTNINGFVYGEAEEVDRLKADELKGTEVQLLDYQPVESRIKQHMGYISILNQIDFKKIITKINAYQTSCSKLIYLVYIVKTGVYDTYEGQWREVCMKMKQASYDGIELLELGKYNVEEVKAILREYIDVISEAYMQL